LLKNSKTPRTNKKQELAQVGKTKRQQWAKMVKAYLLHRKQLSFVLVLVDARHEPQKLDIAMINWLGKNHAL
jgi:GTP-binding protein